jgi:hypothetical protein
MNASNRIVILIRRKKTGVCKDQQYYSGENYINQKVRLLQGAYP